MQFSSKQEQLRQLLEAQYALLRQTFPQNRHDALLALARAGNRHYIQSQHNNVIGYVSLSSLQKALSLCFSTEHTQVNTSTATLDIWADATLQTCTRLAEAERILDYCDSGFMAYAARQRCRLLCLGRE